MLIEWPVTVMYSLKIKKSVITVGFLLIKGVVAHRALWHPHPHPAPSPSQVSYWCGWTARPDAEVGVAFPLLEQAMNIFIACSFTVGLAAHLGQILLCHLLHADKAKMLIIKNSGQLMVLRGKNRSLGFWYLLLPSSVSFIYLFRARGGGIFLIKCHHRLWKVLPTCIYMRLGWVCLDSYV